MRSRARLFLVAAMIATMIIDPATACRFCGGGRGYHGGSYAYQSYGYGNGYGCGYESSCGSGWYPSEGCSESYESHGCGSCGGETVAYDDGCSSCGGCSNCGSSSAGEVIYGESPSMDVMESAPTSSEPMMAPTPPSHTPTPSTVNRPPQMESRPSLPQPAQPRVEEPTFAPSTPRYQEPAAAPATPPANDDLFSTPAPSTTEEPASPATPPADSSNDLFAPSTQPATPPQSTEPMPSAPADTSDLFAPADPAATSPAPESTVPSTDDLFSTPPAEETNPPAEATPPSTDDLFNSSTAIMREMGGLASTEMRNWSDNTGNYSCRGRLIRVLDGKVQLLKENERTSTVPLGRLSKSDLEFVNRQASALQLEGASQTAQVQNVN